MLSVITYWIGNLTSTDSPGEPQAVGTSLIDPFDPGGRGAVSARRSLLFNRSQTILPALPLLPSVYPLRGHTSALTLPNYYMNYYMNVFQISSGPGHE